MKLSEGRGSMGPAGKIQNEPGCIILDDLQLGQRDSREAQVERVAVV